MSSSIKWVKAGGWDQSRVVVYTADRGGFEIIRTRIGGDWTYPNLYRDGRFIHGFRTVREAKAAAANL